SHNVPPQWVAYVSVDDVDLAAKRAVEAGGKIQIPPKDIPNVGRFAYLVDPQGAVIAAFKTATKYEPDDKPKAGERCWNELVTSDPPGAAKFYEKVFGWSHTVMDMGGLGTYTVLKRSADKQVAGVMKQPPESKHPAMWIPYVAVADV